MVSARPWVSTKPMATSMPCRRRRLPSWSMSKVLPTPGGEAEVDLQPAALLPADEVEEGFGLGLEFFSGHGSAICWSSVITRSPGDAQGAKDCSPRRLRFRGGLPPRRRHSGSAMRKTVSRPGSLSHCTVPPWAATISRTIASPRPLPPADRVAGHAEILLEDHRHVLGGNAAPVSLTEKTTAPSPGSAASVIRPPCGVCARALSRRFCKACWS